MQDVPRILEAIAHLIRRFPRWWLDSERKFVRHKPENQWGEHEQRFNVYAIGNKNITLHCVLGEHNDCDYKKGCRCICHTDDFVRMRLVAIAQRAVDARNGSYKRFTGNLRENLSDETVSDDNAGDEETSL